MSREIKFRVYDQTSKDYTVYGIDEVVVEDFGLGIISRIVWRLRGIKHKFIIEQYTGLIDKNGKEIYEGDIVNLEYYEKPFGKKRWNKTYPRKGGKDINVVGFEGGYFKFYKENKDGYGSELSLSDYGEWEGKDGAYKYVAEVIGNIHENPELLEN